MNDKVDTGRRRHPAANEHGELGLAVDMWERDNVLVVTARGVIDFWSVGLLQERLNDAFQTGKARLVLDVHDVSFVDSTGLGLLLMVHDRASAAGGWLRLAGPQPLVRRVLETMNLDGHLNVHASVDAAVERI